MKLGEIDTIKETFSADVFIQARWREPRLDGSQMAKTIVRFSHHYLNFSNRIEVEILKSTWVFLLNTVATSVAS